MTSMLRSTCKPRQEEYEDDFVVVPEKETTSQDSMPEVFRMPKCGDHHLYEISVDELQHLLSTSDLTSAKYVKFCLQRIQEVGLSL